MTITPHPIFVRNDQKKQRKKETTNLSPTPTPTPTPHLLKTIKIHIDIVSN